MFLLCRTSGLSPHIAKIKRPMAEAKLITLGFPGRRFNDLQSPKVFLITTILPETKVHTGICLTKHNTIQNPSMSEEYT